MQFESQDILVLFPTVQSCGFAFYDSKNSSISVMEASNTQIESNLEKILFKYLPNIICIAPNTNPTIESMIKKNSEAELVNLEINDFNYQNGIDSMSKILFTVPSDEQDSIRQSVLSGIINLQSKLIIGAIGALVQFTTKKFGASPVVSVFSLMDVPSGLIISTSSMSDLQIMKPEVHPSIHQLSTKEGVSLFTLLNRTSTLMGKNTLKEWFLSIPSDIGQINQRLDILESFVNPNFHPIVNELVTKLKPIQDIMSIIQKLKKGVAKAKNWQSLYKSLFNAANLLEYIDNHPLHEYLTCKYDISDNIINLLRSLSSHIEATFDFSKSDLYVRDDLDAELSRLRNIYRNLDQMLDKKAHELIDDLPVRCPITTLTVVYIPQLGFLTMVSKEGVRENDFPSGYSITFQTETHYYCKNDKMSDLDRDIGDIYQNVQAREIKIIVRLCDRVLSHAHELINLHKFIGEIDVYCSLAVASVENHWTRPMFVDSNMMRIVNGRHPLLEKIQENFIPNTVELGDDSPKIIVVTGPNGSGKSILLKQTALICYMANIGCFVPCDECIIPHINAIIPVIHNGGASEPFSSGFLDDLRGLSSAIKKSTRNTLIIVDEFGKTSCRDDGAALLAGFIKSMSERGSECPFILISTHFRDALKQNCIDVSQFTRLTMSVSCEVNKNDLIFLYKAFKGEDENSYGFECAERAGFPEDLVERAREVCKYLKNGNDVPASPLCSNRSDDQKMKRAVNTFLNWNENSNPRALIAAINNIFSENQ